MGFLGAPSPMGGCNAGGLRAMGFLGAPLPMGGYNAGGLRAIMDFLEGAISPISEESEEASLKGEVFLEADLAAMADLAGAIVLSPMGDAGAIGLAAMADLAGTIGLSPMAMGDAGAIGFLAGMGAAIGFLAGTKTSLTSEESSMTGLDFAGAAIGFFRGMTASLRMSETSPSISEQLWDSMEQGSALGLGLD